MSIRTGSWSSNGGTCLVVKTNEGTISMVEAGHGEYASRQTYPDLEPDVAYKIAKAALKARKSFRGNTFLQHVEGGYNFYFTRYKGYEIVVGRE